MSYFKTALFLIIAFAVLSQSATAIAGPTATIQSFSEPIIELYERHKKYCGVYKVVIDDNTYIMTTCGGIILVPKT